MNKMYSTIFKNTITVLCIVGFVCNSLIIFKQFIDEETITLHDVEKHGSLYFPSLTFCSLQGFKNPNTEFSDFHLEKYLNNTRGFGEIIHSIDAIKVENLSLHSMLKVSTTLTVFRGQCHTVEYPEKVNLIAY